MKPTRQAEKIVKVTFGVTRKENIESSPLVVKCAQELSSCDKIIYTLIHFYIHMMFVSNFI